MLIKLKHVATEQDKTRCCQVAPQDRLVLQLSLLCGRPIRLNQLDHLIHKGYSALLNM